MFPAHLRLTYLKNRRVTIDILSPDGKLPFCHGFIPAMLDQTGLYILNTKRFKPKAIGHLLTQTERWYLRALRLRKLWL
ncbi:conjugation system SOS inhibitor PsiB family protein [Pantoea sp. NPDC088449]|uniref:conjugation system SOS inhibitor PsiB family protein n=1 Tax=Pantoea sp. NPDC088449 TaxID=3364392 RepID=UPI003827624B